MTTRVRSCMKAAKAIKFIVLGYRYGQDYKHKYFKRKLVYFMFAVTFHYDSRCRTA